MMVRNLSVLIQGLIVVGAVSLFPGCSEGETQTQTKPNIVVIFTDDQGYADLGIQGIVEDIKTPHLDQLGRDGIRMTSGYITAPQCVPSRAGIISGRYQQRFGVDHNGTFPVPLDEVLLPQRMKEAGYSTGMVGKWHLDPNFNLEGEDMEPQFITVDRFRLDVQSDAAISFIDRNHKKPFFLYLSYFAPHVPLEATDKYLSRFPGEMPERRRYCLAMMSAIDDGVGRLRESLRQYEIDENTLIFFISDNGAPTKMIKEDITLEFKGGAWDGSLNDPLVGEKGMLSEGGIRVPFLVSWPAVLPKGRVYDKPVISLDVAATAVAVAGLEHPAELDGINLIPYLTGEKQESPHAFLFWRFWDQTAVRSGNWKFLKSGEREFLFNLGTDGMEQENLIHQYPERAEALKEELEKWASDLYIPGVPEGPMRLERPWYDFYFPLDPAGQ